MKKYLKALPILLFPYSFYLFICSPISKLESLIEQFGGNFFVSHDLWSIYNFLVLLQVLYSAIRGFRRYTPTEAAKVNCFVKLGQIPAYIFHFMLGLAGSVASVWGIGFVLFAIIIDLATIIISGIHAIGVVRRLKKEGVLSLKTAILAGIGSFLYCVDIAVAIVLLALCDRHKKKSEASS